MIDDFAIRANNFAESKNRQLKVSLPITKDTFIISGYLYVTNKQKTHWRIFIQSGTSSSVTYGAFRKTASKGSISERKWLFR